MKYKLGLKKKAHDDLIKLSKEDETAYRKALKLISELYEHPRTGTGKPELLKGDLKGRWSRRINRKHRLVYKIDEIEVIVLVISAYGHYSDK